jgi:ankyrin repeat protein
VVFTKSTSMGNCTHCIEACACCEYVDVPDKVLWKEMNKKPIRVWKIVRLLTVNRASPNATQRNMRGQRDTILHFATRLGEFNVIDELVTQGATLETASELTDTTPMQHLIKTNRKDLIRFFVEMNVNLSFLHNGETTLTWLVQQQEYFHLLPEIFNAISKSEKADRLSGTNNDGLNALQVCIFHKLQKPMEILYQYNFPLDAPTARGSPALHFAIEIFHDLAVERLLDEGASIGGRDQLRRTPLLVAVITRNANATRIILEEISQLTVGSKNARLHDFDVGGNTAVHYGTVDSRGGILELLLRSGCSPDSINKDQLSPIHIAASEGNAPVTSMLIEFGCDFEITDSTGKSAIHRALQHGHIAVVGILLDNGARSIGFAKDNTTPLMAARESFLLGNLGTDVLTRIDRVETAASLNEAQNRVEREIEKKKRKAKQKKAQKKRELEIKKNLKYKVRKK